MRTAIGEPWPNGQTEGKAAELELVERQMYSRSRVDLPRVRTVQLG